MRKQVQVFFFCYLHSRICIKIIIFKNYELALVHAFTVLHAVIILYYEEWLRKLRYLLTRITKLICAFNQNQIITFWPNRTEDWLISKIRTDLLSCSSLSKNEMKHLILKIVLKVHRVLLNIWWAKKKNRSSQKQSHSLISTSCKIICKII